MKALIGYGSDVSARVLHDLPAMRHPLGRINANPWNDRIRSAAADAARALRRVIGSRKRRLFPSASTTECSLLRDGSSVNAERLVTNLGRKPIEPWTSPGRPQTAQEFSTRYNSNDGIRTPLMRTRWRLAPVSLSLIVLATVINPSRAFQQKSLVNAGDPSTIEDFKAGDANREPYQRATELLKALGVTGGDWVADVGAGSGYYVMRLSGIVGQEGKVFAEDISDSSIRWLGTRAKVFALPNVEIVKGDADNPNFRLIGLPRF